MPAHQWCRLLLLQPLEIAGQVSRKGLTKPQPASPSLIGQALPPELAVWMLSEQILQPRLNSMRLLGQASEAGQSGWLSVHQLIVQIPLVAEAQAWVAAERVVGA